MSTSKTPAKQLNPWWVAVINGMASYIDSCTIITSGIALVIYQQTYGLSDMQFGALSAALTFCIAIGSIAGGRLGDIFGRKPVFSVTMAMLVLGALLMVISSNFALLLIGEILMGLGVGADLPVSLASISEQAPDDKRGKMLLFSDILWVVGIVVAQGIGSIVGDWGLLGGQIMFGQLAAVSAVVLILRQTIPESPVWVEQNELRKQGVVTKEDTGKVGDLFRTPYAVPFIALMVFYIGTNVPANSLGQFSTWIGANVVELPISLVSTIGLIVYPIRAILDFVFMHFVDTPKRMPLFYMGAVLYLAGFLMFPVFGASATTYLLTQLLYCIGAAFAFEGILKVWMQECFPTLLRTTANGAIVFVSRFSCAVVGFFTASFIAMFGYKVAFWALSAMCLIGFAAAIWAFRGKRYNTFDTAEAQAQPAEAKSASAPSAEKVLVSH